MGGGRITFRKCARKNSRPHVRDIGSPFVHLHQQCDIITAAEFFQIRAQQKIETLAPTEVENIEECKSCSPWHLNSGKARVEVFAIRWDGNNTNLSRIDPSFRICPP